MARCIEAARRFIGPIVPCAQLGGLLARAIDAWEQPLQFIVGKI